jgi:Protein kinase domain
LSITSRHITSLLSITHSLTLSVPLSHTHADTHTLTHLLSLSLSLSLTHTHTRTQTLTHTLSLSLTHTHAHAHTFSFSSSACNTLHYDAGSVQILPKISFRSILKVSSIFMYIANLFSCSSLSLCPTFSFRVLNSLPTAHFASFLLLHPTHLLALCFSHQYAPYQFLIFCILYLVSVILTGESCSGIYELHGSSKLGKGSYGSVYLATHRLTGDERAVKVMNVDKVTSYYLRKLHTEISILKSLDHPNIVRLQDVFFGRRSLYLATELCRGGELFELSCAGKSEGYVFREDRTSQLMKDMLSAVHYLHSKVEKFNSTPLMTVFFVLL